MVYSYKSPHHAHGATVVASPTALHKAADVNDAAAVIALLRGAADPNARVECRNCDEGATALHLAAQKVRVETLSSRLPAAVIIVSSPFHGSAFMMMHTIAGLAGCCQPLSFQIVFLVKSRILVCCVSLFCDSWTVSTTAARRGNPNLTHPTLVPQEMPPKRRVNQKHAYIHVR